MSRSGSLSARTGPGPIGGIVPEVLTRLECFEIVQQLRWNDENSVSDAYCNASIVNLRSTLGADHNHELENLPDIDQRIHKFLSAKDNVHVRFHD
jgi:hypothetical protein